MTLIGSQGVNYTGGSNAILSSPNLEIYSTQGNTFTGAINFQNLPGSASTIFNTPIIDMFANSITFGTSTMGNTVITGPAFTGTSSLRNVEALKAITIDAPSGIAFTSNASILSNGNISMAAASDIIAVLGGTKGSFEAGGSFNVITSGTFSVFGAASNTSFLSSKDMNIFAANAINDLASVGVFFNSTGGTLTLDGASGGVFLTSGGGLAGFKGLTVTSAAGPVTSITLTGGSLNGGLGNVTVGSSKNIVFSGAIVIQESIFGEKDVTISTFGPSSNILYNNANGINTTGNITINGGSVDVGGRATTLKGAISIGASTNLQILANSTIAAAKNLSLTNTNPAGSINFLDKDALTAGTKVAFNSFSTIAKSTLKSTGTLTINSAGTIAFFDSTGTGSSFQAFGGNVNVIAHGAPPLPSIVLSLGSNNTFQAVGGNVSILTSAATGNIFSSPTAGTTGNFYNAVAATAGSAFSGGGIEIQSGKATSDLPPLLANRPAPFVFNIAVGQDVSGAFFTPGFQTKGSVTVASNASGVILNNGVPLTHAMLVEGNDPSAVNPVIIIKANGTSTVTLDSVIFESVTPIGNSVPSGIDQEPTEIVVDSDVDFGSAD
jgi:hypothetical protein